MLVTGGVPPLGKGYSLRPTRLGFQIGGPRQESWAKLEAFSRHLFFGIFRILHHGP